MTLSSVDILVYELFMCILPRRTLSFISCSSTFWTTFVYVDDFATFNARSFLDFEFCRNILIWIGWSFVLLCRIPRYRTMFVTNIWTTALLTCFYVLCLSPITALGESVLSAPHGCASNEVLNLDPLVALHRSLSCGRLAPENNLKT